MIELCWLDAPAACSHASCNSSRQLADMCSHACCAATAAEKMIADRRQRAKLKAKQSHKEKAGRSAAAPPPSESPGGHMHAHQISPKTIGLSGCCRL